ncbi:hypothetical protein GY14_20985 [Delftia tsuruhatensis]|nr:hypothetical protein GY14_20985 [Delftia tsuruhatensis]
MWSSDLVRPARSCRLLTSKSPEGARSALAVVNQRHRVSSGRAVHCVEISGFLRSKRMRVTARQPSQGRRLWMWSTLRRGPVSVLMPTPKTHFCIWASRTWAMTGVVTWAPLRLMASSSSAALSPCWGTLASVRKTES